MTDTQERFDYRAFVRSAAGLSGYQNRQYDREVDRVATGLEERDKAVAASIMEQALDLVPNKEAWRPRINRVLVNAGLPEVPEPQPEPQPEAASFQADGQGQVSANSEEVRLGRLERLVGRLADLAENRLGARIDRS